MRTTTRAIALAGAVVTASVAFAIPAAANDFEGSAVGLHTFRSPGIWVKLRAPLRPSWGEPYLQIAHRMLAAVYTAVHEADGRAAVLVSHQLPIVTVRRYLEGRRLWHDPRRRECAVAVACRRPG